MQWLSWLGLVPVLAGAMIAVVGALGSLARLPRNRFFGVRTAATLRADEAFQKANRVAGPPLVVAGLVGVAGGLVAITLPAGSALVIAGIGLAGTLLVTVRAGVLGDRAAAATTTCTAGEPSAGCGGSSACGSCPIRSVGPDVAGVRGEQG